MINAYNAGLCCASFQPVALHGIIVIGYQGVGKTYCANKNNECIDLESSLFKVDGSHIDGWQVPYCAIAMSLAKSGYVVFVSSHKVVREELAKHAPDGGYSVVIVAPHKSLRDEWVKLLRDRHNTSIGTASEAKNLAAWKDAEANFDNEIDALARQGDFSCVFLEKSSAHLSDIIVSLKRVFTV